MELCSSLQSLPSPLLSHRGFTVSEKPLGSSCKVPTLKRHPHARNLKGRSFRTQAVSGVSNSGSVLVEEARERANLKDKNLVFVAGATGKVGSRTVRELLKLGFRVRAGVRSTQKAESLVQSVEQMKLEFEDGSKAVEKLDIVECDLEKKDAIGIALGNASVVICCIGASEKEVFDITGPYRIDFQATKNLVDAATVAKVDHFILVTSLGTNKFGFPAAILNLFWGVLCWKRKAEEALVASGIPYTIVRPGGMERPTDAYKETHNITLSQEDTLFGGQVSNLQVAELMAVMARNPELSYCKIIEVIAETTAPLTPMEDLLTKIPSRRPLPKVPDSASEVSPAVSKGEVSIASTTQSQKEAPQPKSTLAKPLSPYIVYDDLKPPTSPTPTPRTSPPGTSESDADALTAASSPAPSSIPEQLSTTGEEEAPTIEAKKATYLSPYIAYDDLKPPTSPVPTPPSGQKEKVILDAAPKLETPATTETTVETPEPAIQEQRAQPLSPYVVYEDMKPPTSPSPTGSGPKVVIATGTTSTEFISPSTGGNDAIENVDAGVDEKDPPQKLTSFQSPYVAYDDLKPPTSPSPNAPNGAVSPPSPNGGIQAITENTAQSPTEDKVTENQNQPTVRPLSPYTMYEDLKPPSSPAPLPPSPKSSS